MGKTVCAFAPATIANVNVGFDVLGLALSGIGDTIEITENHLKENRVLEIISETPLPTDADKNCCTVVIRKMQEALNSDLFVDVRIRKGFASGSGLGSSSASSAAAAYAFNEIAGKPFTEEELIHFAAEGERVACGFAHLDNVSPALLGGWVLIYQGKTVRLPVPENLYAVSFFPNIEIKTSSARSIVSQKTSLSITAWQAAMGAFVASLYQGDEDLMRASLKDYIVEPTRKILIPFFDEMRDKALENGAITFGISGSVPSVFALEGFLQSDELGMVLATAHPNKFDEVMRKAIADFQPPKVDLSHCTKGQIRNDYQEYLKVILG
ncbi:homoserine kinase [Riemerella columbina]|uniref:homoserine kinase n=1 Tax=Riemerella columbina TaxID=103810 RepID=UPI000364F98A|nr:homoserine kinase [Riemerella columbina]